MSTGSQGDLQLIVEEPQGVGDGQALGTGPGGHMRVGHVAAETGVVGFGHVDRVIEIVGETSEITRPGITVLVVEHRTGQHPLMRHRTCLQGVAHAHLTGSHCLFTVIIEARRSGHAVGVGGGVGQHVLLFTFAHADGSPGGERIGEVILGTEGAECLLLLGVRPGLAVVLVGIRRARYAACRGDAGQRIVDEMVLVPNVGRKPQAFALVVQAQGEHVQGAVLVLYRRFPVALGHVHAHAKTVLLPEAARHVSRNGTEAAIFNPSGQAGKGFVRGAFRQDVDGAADPGTAGGGAIKEGVGPAEYLDPFDELRCHVLTRKQAIQAVIGDVVGIQREAPHDIQFLEVAETTGDPHGGVVLQDVRHAVRLLVLDQLVGIGRGCEGRFHVVLVAQDTHAPAPGHLPPFILRNQAILGGVCAGRNCGFFKLQDRAIGTRRIHRLCNRHRDFQRVLSKCER